jgi:hypothetical protein
MGRPRTEKMVVASLGVRPLEEPRAPWRLRLLRWILDRMLYLFGQR